MRERSTDEPDDRTLLELLLVNESLTDQLNFLEAVLEVADMLVVVLDRSGQIVRFNRACEEATGYAADEVVGKLIWDVVIPREEAEAVKEVLSDLLEGKGPNRGANVWLRRDGGRIDTEWCNTVLPGTSGEVRFVVGTGLDVTRRRRTERQLQSSEGRQAAIIEAALEGILVVDQNGVVELANQALHEMFGYAQGELVGRHFETLIPGSVREEHRDHHPRFFQEARSRPMSPALSILGRRRDGSEFPMSVSLGYCQTCDGQFAVALVSDRTEVEKQRSDLERSRDEVRRLAASLLTAKEDEDRRIARHLHDGLVQDLAALSIELGGLAHRPPSSPDELESELRRLETTARSVAEQARDWSHEIHPAAVESLGLAKSLQSLCDTISRQSRIPVRFTAVEPPPEPPFAQSICLYRVTQEALLNAVKHSGADNVHVRLGKRNGFLFVEIADNGRGFDRDSERTGSGLGLISIEERARLIGGSVHVETKPGDGTSIEVLAPIRENKP